MYTPLAPKPAKKNKRSSRKSAEAEADEDEDEHEDEDEDEEAAAAAAVIAVNLAAHWRSWSPCSSSSLSASSNLGHPPERHSSQESNAATAAAK